MQQLSNQRKLIFIISGIVVLLIAVIAIATHDSTPTNQTPQDFIGNASGTPDGGRQTTAAFVGYDNLVNAGVTLQQINALQTAFQRYQPFSASTTVIDVSHGILTPLAPSPSDPLYRPAIKTTVVVNQKTTYTIKFYFWDITKIQLLIYDNSGKTELFDSGTVTGAN